MKNAKFWVPGFIFIVIIFSNIYGLIYDNNLMDEQQLILDKMNEKEVAFILLSPYPKTKSLIDSVKKINNPEVVTDVTR